MTDADNMNALLKEVSELQLKKIKKKKMTANDKNRLSSIKEVLFTVLFLKEGNPPYDSLSADIFQEVVVDLLNHSFHDESFLSSIMIDEKPWELFYAEFLTLRIEKRTEVYRAYPIIVGDRQHRQIFDDIALKRLYEVRKKSENLYEKNEIRDKVKKILKEIKDKAIKQISDESRKIIMLRSDREGVIYTYKDIANKLGIKAGNARKKGHDARQKICKLCIKYLTIEISQEKDKQVQEKLMRHKRIIQSRIKEVKK